MPYLDSLPLGWVKQSECACLIEILHMTMVIDATQDTTQKFEQIKTLATHEYRKHFDAEFQPLPTLPQKQNYEDLAVALNNRAAIMPI